MHSWGLDEHYCIVHRGVKSAQGRFQNVNSEMAGVWVILDFTTLMLQRTVTRTATGPPRSILGHYLDLYDNVFG